MQLQVRAGHDDRAARVVDALAEQVLAEAALLALQHVRERLQGPVARARHRAAAAAVVEQRVDGLLQHALLVVDDDLRRAQVEQPLEAVVPVDHAAVEIVEVGGGEPAAVELHHRAELRRDHRHGLEDHPLRLVLRLDERLDDLEPLDRPLLLLALRRLDRLAQLAGLLVEIEVAEQVTDGLRTHSAPEVLTEAVGRPEAVLQLAEELLVVDDELRLELAEELPRLLQPAHALDGGLPRVVAPRVHVLHHLADLERPLGDDVEVVLLRAGEQAEVVRELAHLLHRLPDLLLREDVDEQAIADLSRLVEVLRVDPRRQLGVVRRELGTVASASVSRWRCFVIAPFFEPGRSLELRAERVEGLVDLLGRGGDGLDLARGELAVLTRRRLADELTDLLRVLGRQRLRELGKMPPASCRVSSRVGSSWSSAQLLRPRVQNSSSSSKFFSFPREILSPPREALLDREDVLVAVDVDLLRLAAHLVLEVGQVLRPLLEVDRR